MRADDEDVETLLKNFTFMEMSEIDNLMAEHSVRCFEFLIRTGIRYSIYLFGFRKIHSSAKHNQYWQQT